MEIKPGIHVEINNEKNIIYKIFVVYFINCTLNKNWDKWIITDLNLLRDLDCTVYVVTVVNKYIKDLVKKTIDNIISGATVIFYYNNEYEYRGILKVWELSQEHNASNDILLYYHSKNITKKIIPDNKNYVLKKIITNHKKVLDIFNRFKTINKIGLYCSNVGFIWYNYWWARGSYLRGIEKPIKTLNRYYYEDWICRRVLDSTNMYPETQHKIDKSRYLLDINDCYNLNFQKKNIYNIGSYFIPPYKYIK